MIFIRSKRLLPSFSLCWRLPWQKCSVSPFRGRKIDNRSYLTYFFLNRNIPYTIICHMVLNTSVPTRNKVRHLALLSQEGPSLYQVEMQNLNDKDQTSS